MLSQEIEQLIEDVEFGRRGHRFAGDSEPSVFLTLDELRKWHKRIKALEDFAISEGVNVGVDNE